MQTSGLTERVEAAILEQVFSDDELENRVRSLLRWKIRFNAVHVAVGSGHVTLSGQVISALDRETAEQTIRRLRGVVGVTNCIIASPTTNMLVYKTIARAVNTIPLVGLWVLCRSNA